MACQRYFQIQRLKVLCLFSNTLSSRVSLFLSVSLSHTRSLFTPSVPIKIQLPLSLQSASFSRQHDATKFSNLRVQSPFQRGSPEKRYPPRPNPKIQIQTRG